MTENMAPVLQKSQPHPRRLIRARVAELLKAGTDLNGRWFISRPLPAFLDEMPCGLIYFTEEDSEHKKKAPRTYDRTCRITTEVLHAEETDRDGSLDDFLDSRAFEIERALYQYKFLGLDDLVQDVELRRTVPITVEMEGAENIAGIRLFWDVQYSFDAFTPEGFDEFLRFVDTIQTVRPGAAIDDNVRIREQ